MNNRIGMVASLAAIWISVISMVVNLYQWILLNHVKTTHRMLSSTFEWTYWGSLSLLTVGYILGTCYLWKRPWFAAWLDSEADEDKAVEKASAEPNLG